ncbi:hypothetical protein AgCh_013397 [Apium graveolens]
MDWYSWLSKAGLDPLLTYKYGRIFTNSHLQEEDILRFDHEFLQSLGVSVTRHRLEILKLCDKKVNKDSIRFNIALAIKKTKRLLRKYWTSPGITLMEHLRPWTSQWKKKETLAYNNKRRIMKSGPMERTKRETCVMKNNRSVSKSGPVDMKMPEKLMSTSWNSPSPLCGYQYGTYRETPLHEKALDESEIGINWSFSPKVESHYTNKKSQSHYTNKETVSRDELASIWSSMFKDIKPT